MNDSRTDVYRLDMMLMDEVEYIGKLFEQDGCKITSSILTNVFS
ncbi:hypothetical protein Hdeb2414_s0008g00264001 [Helianthus debilis subsp. tardiflorus]